jgi:hypothetical protein
MQVDVIYVFAFVWSFGCNLDDTSRSKFNDFVSALLSPLIPDEVRGHDLFGFYVDPHSMSLVPWAKQMSKFAYDPKVWESLCTVCHLRSHPTLVPDPCRAVWTCAERSLCCCGLGVTLCACRRPTSTSLCPLWTPRATRT